MAKTRRSNRIAQVGRRRLLALVVMVSAGVGLLGFAYAQSSATISLNSPVSFPVDI